MIKADIILLYKLKQNSLHRDRADLEEVTDTKPKARAGNSDTENQRSGFPESGHKFKKGCHELISQPCSQLLPCYMHKYTANKRNIRKFICISILYSMSRF